MEEEGRIELGEGREGIEKKRVKRNWKENEDTKKKKEGKGKKKDEIGQKGIERDADKTDKKSNRQNRQQLRLEFQPPLTYFFQYKTHFTPHKCKPHLLSIKSIKIPFIIHFQTVKSCLS